MIKLLRIYKIFAVFKAYQLAELLPTHQASKWLKISLFSLFWVRKKAKNQPVGERLRQAIQELGPVWIKFGQLLSTRRDVLPETLAEPLTKLQDQVPPFPGEQAKRIIEQALGQPVEALFDDFSTTSFASASIAQIHTATLKRSQASVIIKVLRPDILPQIQSDLQLMHWAADLIPRCVRDGEKLHAADIVRDYERTILNELDLAQEAENTLRLRHNFLNSPILYIPYVYRDLCRTNVLVEERIYAVPISNIAELKRNHVDLKLLAERGVQVFFTQVFRDNYFHADMHPGNIFVNITDPSAPSYIGIDCAIVGELSKEDQHYLAENLIAFFNRDYQRIAQLYILSGWVPEETDVLKLERAMRAVCEPIFAKPLGEISFAQVLFSLFQVARQFNMDIQPQLVLLEKTLFYIEGIGKQLYPDLDLWKTAKPFLESWYSEQIGVKHLFVQLKETLPLWRNLLPELPNRIYQQQRENRNLKFKVDQLSNQILTLNKKQNRRCVIIALLVGIVLLYHIL